MIDLPVPVLQHPHWRVNFRPAVYEDNLIPTLAKCFEIIEKNRVSLRGWDFPHLSRRDEERGRPLTVERADGLEVPPGFLELDILTDDVHYVQPLLHLIDDGHDVTSRTNDQS